MATRSASGRIRIVGAGFTGAVLARELAEAGYSVVVTDKRDHVAGNCHTERDETGVMVHKYGPHIFHTDKKDVWDYVSQFGDFEPYVHRVKATTERGVFSLPLNLLTINQLRGERYSPAEAAAYMQSVTRSASTPPLTFEEQAEQFVGEEIYRVFFYGYTLKQWGREPSELPASVLKRLPIRFNYDDNYFNHPYQGIPRDGYTSVVERMLDHPRIDVDLSNRQEGDPTEEWLHTFWSGPIDAYFGFTLGPLPYRTIRFEVERSEGDFQGCAQMNYCEPGVPFTRITEHKHLAPWESHKSTVTYREYSEECQIGDDPYYPIRLASETELLRSYVELASMAERVSFVGRLGTYRYMDMDVTIHAALEAARAAVALLRVGRALPAFFDDPLANS